MALLKDCGFEADAIDLTGSGVDSSDTNNITSLAQYVKPLVDFLDKLGDEEKVYSLYIYMCNMCLFWTLL